MKFAGLKLLLPFVQPTFRNAVINVADVRNAEVAGSFCRRPKIDHLAGGQHQCQVAALDVVDVVRDADQRTALVGELAKEPHQARLGAGVEPAGGFVNVEQTGASQQLGAEAGTLDLAPGKIGHQRVAVRPQFHDLDDLLDPGHEFVGGGVRRQPQTGGVVECPENRQLGMDDVLLGNVA